MAFRLLRMFLVHTGLLLVFAGLVIFTTISGFGTGERVGTFIDAFYVAYCTVFSVGFGDISPLKSLTRILCDVLGLVVGPIVVMVLTHFLGRLACELGRWISSRFLMRYRVYSTLGMILLALFLGMAGIYIFEWLHLAGGSPSPSPSTMLPTDAYAWVLFVDIFHLSVMMMNTTGFGDFAFTTAFGRAFTIVWVPFSTIVFMVAGTFLAQTFLFYLARIIGGYSLPQGIHRH
ncbi:two-pore potassium channel 4 [Rosa chinensis]|uniref:two-pore potassium channel 4 n=1 Tax=Rosa chinensis TaxID=74649 RepID=UPI000D0961C6|nr:two-pore potassium channel 4 [Rosa chinensis]